MLSCHLKRHAIAAAALVISSVAPASAMAPLQCQDFVIYAMRVQADYYSRGCAPVPQMHSDRDRHFRWCMSHSEREVRADRATKDALLRQCVASVRRPAPPPPVDLCRKLSGSYNGRSGSIAPAGGDRIRVTVGPRRPVAYGTCRNGNLTVDFTDDHVINGRFDGRVIRWDNNTNWRHD